VSTVSQYNLMKLYHEDLLKEDLSDYAGLLISRGVLTTIEQADR